MCLAKDSIWTLGHLSRIITYVKKIQVMNMHNLIHNSLKLETAIISFKRLMIKHTGVLYHEFYSAIQKNRFLIHIT